MPFVSRTYSGIPSRISQDGKAWIGEFVPAIPELQRPYGLRGTYRGDFDTICRVLEMVAQDWEGTRSQFTGHTPDCEAQNTLDESDCDCYFPTLG